MKTSIVRWTRIFLGEPKPKEAEFNTTAVVELQGNTTEIPIFNETNPLAESYLDASRNSISSDVDQNIAEREESERASLETQIFSEADLVATPGSYTSNEAGTNTAINTEPQEDSIGNPLFKGKAPMTESYEKLLEISESNGADHNTTAMGELEDISPGSPLFDQTDGADQYFEKLPGNPKSDEKDQATTTSAWESICRGEVTFDKANLPDQSGRVFIVTGGSTGVGYEVAKILYNLNGTVYITSRSEEKARAAILSMQSSSNPRLPEFTGGDKLGKGRIEFLRLDLADLPTIIDSAQTFYSKESRLDVIWHTAEVLSPGPIKEKCSHPEQRYHELLCINVLGPFLFQHFLNKICIDTASLRCRSKFDTRVIFASSSSHRESPRPDGVAWDDINLTNSEDLEGKDLKYAQSKAMNVMIANEFAWRHRRHGLASFSLDPGAPNSAHEHAQAVSLNKRPVDLEALTLLFAGLVKIQNYPEYLMVEHGGKNGGHILPWGRFGSGSPHVMEGLAARRTGTRLWELCEDILEKYLLKEYQGVEEGRAGYWGSKCSVC